MPVVAMTREMGSRGREVAERVAEDLGLTLVLHELIEHDLAERLQVPASAVHHRFEGGATLRERWQIPNGAWPSTRPRKSSSWRRRETS